MANYGLRIKDAAGNITLNITDIVGRIRYYTVAASGDSSSIDLSDISGKTVHAFSVPLEALKLAHEVTISGTTFTWTAKSVSIPYVITNCDSLIGVIIED